jgi:hypothetical protein
MIDKRFVYWVPRHCLTLFRCGYWTKLRFTGKTGFTPQICQHDYGEVCSMTTVRETIPW